MFELPDTRRILSAGKSCGLNINFHGDELSPIQAAELGAELGAVAISHLEHISEKGMKDMAEKGVVAVLLPTTAYILRIKPPPAKKLLEHNVTIAIGTDFNPNAHCFSLPFTMNLSCISMGLNLSQALNAATINAAGSMNKAQLYGSLSPGKYGDFLILSAEKWEHLIYQMIDPPIVQVWKKGQCVWKQNEINHWTGVSVEKQCKKQENNSSSSSHIDRSNLCHTAL